MDKFVVSARKYRPGTFTTVVGQDTIVKTLKNAILNEHLAQAFIFTGPRGVGKTTCARIMAKTINCKNITPEGDPCNECDSCRDFNNNASLNIYELDAASNSSVDDIRTLVEQVRVPPHEGKYKIYIIDEVHMLSAAAFNAFLKTLEEPPAYAKFILATTERHKIIPTILSRCQIYNFKRITVDDIAKHLAFVAEKEGISAEAGVLHIIAQKADGALRDALSLFDQVVTFSGKNITYQQVIDNLNILDFDYYFKFVDCFLNKDYKQAVILLNEVLDNGFDGQHIISGLASHFRQLLMSIDPKTAILLECGELLSKRYQDQARKTDVKFLVTALDMVNKAAVSYNQSSQKHIFLESLFLQLSFLIDNMMSAQIGVDTKKKITSSIAEKGNAIVSAKISTATTKNENLGAQMQMLSLKQTYQKLSEESNREKIKTIFTEEDLKAAVSKYCNIIKDDKKILYGVLINSAVELKDNFQIEFILSGEIQKADVDANKQQINRFLSEELKNDFITISCVVVKNADNQGVKNFSEEFFDRLKEINSDIEYFRNTFNLKIEL